MPCGLGAGQALALRVAQAVAGFEAGRCAETQIKAAPAAERAKLTADAKSYYTFVVQKHPDSEYAPKAKQRLARL